jgi:hypothetical protein
METVTTERKRNRTFRRICKGIYVRRKQRIVRLNLFVYDTVPNALIVPVHTL